RERVVGIGKFLAIDAVLFKKIRDRRLGGENLMVPVDGIENQTVQALGFAQHFERVIKARVRNPGFAESRRYAAKHDIGRQLPDPRLDDGLESIAMRATVPEELDDFDLGLA